MITTIASNWFMLSIAYDLIPIPRTFTTISKAKIQVEALLIVSNVAAWDNSMGYRSIERVIVLIVMHERIKIVKY
jgi:hypothetical protein